MELFFILLVILPAAILVLGGAIRSWTGFRLWGSLGEDLVAALGPQAMIDGDTVHAVWHGSRITLRQTRLGARQATLNIEIVAQGVPLEVVLRPVENKQDLHQTKRFATGDQFFDRNVITEGPDDVLGAVLSAEARRLAVVAICGRLVAWVVGGVGRRGFVYSGSFDPFALARELAPPALLMQALGVPPGGVPAGLLAQVRSDPQAAVRVTCLELLCQHYPESAEAQEALENADRDKASRVRYVAAMRRVGGTEDRLLALARAERTSVSVRLDAVEELSRRLVGPRFLDLVSELLREPHREVKLEAIRWIGRLEMPEAAKRLELLRDEPDPEMAAAASDALSRQASAAGRPVEEGPEVEKQEG
jgi:hypothetical protein